MTSKPFPSSVRTLSDSILLSVTREHFRDVVLRQEEVKRKEEIDFLKSSVYFDQMSEKDLCKLIERADKRRFTRG